MRDLVVLIAPESLLPRVVVGVATHNAINDLGRCLNSIEQQTLNHSDLGVVILLDSPAGFDRLPPLPPGLELRTWIIQANCGSPARARNTIHEFIEDSIPSCIWIARLDWDDRFADERSLEAAVELGDDHRSDYIIGGNRVVDPDGHWIRDNDAGDWLLDSQAVAYRLEQMALGFAENELPSCNLLVRASESARYPDTRSAEDHWLVADLCIHHPRRVAVLESPQFADYTLGGCQSRTTQKDLRHTASRRALHDAARTWIETSELPGQRLGHGQEGVVRLCNDRVTKHFYPGILEAEKAEWLEAIGGDSGIVPAARFREGTRAGEWIAEYDWERTSELREPSPEAVQDFLRHSLDSLLVCGNIKRTNFRVRKDGSLVYIDIGNWVIPMDVSVFRDSSARLYSIGVLGYSDIELLRRPADHSKPRIWERLNGLSSFYGETVGEHLSERWPDTRPPACTKHRGTRNNSVTLLLKACGMDASLLEPQVRHLINQLTTPQDYASRILTIDPHEGPFLREHSGSDLDAVIKTAHRLCEAGLIDEIWIGPTDPEAVRRINKEWFGLDCDQSHTTEGVPLAPQLWAFDRIKTRYVLQCDIDTLICRHDESHDFLNDMIQACQPDVVVGVAFNIPHAQNKMARTYQAPHGEYKPEVRCGLLDLERLGTLRPLPNEIVNRKISEPWYRALHQAQRNHGMRTLRGGDTRTCYLHPPNHLKPDQDGLSRVRDLMEQGKIPSSQLGKWDVHSVDTEWLYSKRSEPLVVIARGRNTPSEKLERFWAGLAMQSDQAFGIVVIDDGSEDGAAAQLAYQAREFNERVTLVRRGRRHGRAANLDYAVKSLCSNTESAIMVVDLDDALVDADAIALTKGMFIQGHDVVLAAPFRPDAPLCVYTPCFDNPRSQYGGDVWIHMRAFKKSLFDRLTNDTLKRQGTWLEMCVDYAVMIPIVEMARSPIYLPRYLYWHERSTGKETAERVMRDRLIEDILASPMVPNTQAH